MCARGGKFNADLDEIDITELEDPMNIWICPILSWTMGQSAVRQVLQSQIESHTTDCWKCWGQHL